MPTIKDIAREAGVSHGTVSNVLNKTGKVSIEKIQLVEQAAKKLGYVPNTQAALLRQGIPHTVALILPSLHEDIYLDLYHAIQDTLFHSNYDLSVYPTNHIASNEEMILKRIPQSSLAAVVIVSCMKESEHKWCSRLSCPVIYVNRQEKAPRPGDMVIRFDHYQIGISIGKYVRSNKWRKVAFFSAPPLLSCDRLLLEGIREALNDSSVFVRHYTSAQNLCINEAFNIVQSEHHFDAVITSCMSRADSVATALKFSYMKKQPRIVTLSRLTYLPLTNYLTYQLDYSQMGRTIAKHIIRHSQQKEDLPALITMEPKGFPQPIPQIPKKTEQTLSLLTLDTPTANALSKLLPLFEATSGIHVQLIHASSEDMGTLLNMLNDNFHYDLIRMDMARMDSLGQKTFMPLTEASIPQDLLPESLRLSAYGSCSTIDGVRYSLPFDPSVQILLYRSDLFEDALLRRAYFEKYHKTFSIPATMEQYLQTAEFFTASCTPGSPTEYGTTILDGSAFSMASDFLPYYLAKLSSPGEEAASSIQTDKMTKALEQYLQVLHCAGRPRSWHECIQQLVDGTVAMTTVYSNYAADILKFDHSNMTGKIDAAVLPGGKPLLGGGVIGICRYSKKAAACRQFLEWYFTKDVASMIVQLGGTSPLADNCEHTNEDSAFPWLPVVNQSFELGTRSTIAPSRLSIWDYEFTIGTAVKNMIAGNIQPKETAQMIKNILENLQCDNSPLPSTFST